MPSKCHLGTSPFVFCEWLRQFARLLNENWARAERDAARQARLQFMNIVSRAKPQADFVNLLPYWPSNPQAFDFEGDAGEDADESRTSAREPFPRRQVARAAPAGDLFLYPRLTPVRIVGSDLAHAVPLTLGAGLGHWLIGSVDWHIVGALLLGSLPGISIGSHLAARVSDR